MKFTIDSKSLKDALTLAQKAITSRSTLPVLSCVLIEASKGCITITSDDLEVRLTQTLEAKVELAGDACIPAKQLIAAIHDEQTEVGLVGGKIHIQSGAHTKLGFQEAKEFPQRKCLEPTHKVDLEVFTSALKQVAGSTSYDETRYNLRGVHLSPTSEGDNMVGCDGRIMSYIKDSPVGFELEQSIIIPNSVVALITGCFTGREDALIVATDSEIALSAEGVTMNAKLISAVYPNWRQIAPQVSDSPVKVEVWLLKEAIQSVSAFSVTEQKVEIKPEKETWNITASNQESSSSMEVPVKGEVEGESFLIAGTLLLKILKGWPNDELLVSRSDANSPIALSNPSFPIQAVLMPMRKV